MHIDPPLLAPETGAYFFDLDGTLAEFRLQPAEVSIAATRLDALARLAEAGGAVAVVSGRTLDDIDRLLAPLRLPAAGVHGAQRRGSDGRIHRLPPEALPPPALASELAHAMAGMPGTLFEDKGIALALHYRGAPQYEDRVLDLAQRAIHKHPQLRLQPGKFVAELKPAGVDKGQAIAAFLREPAFAGRTPLFIGDDRTDEAGFAVVDAAGGITIKVGPGETCARYRLADVAEVERWLAALAGAVRS